MTTRREQAEAELEDRAASLVNILREQVDWTFVCSIVWIATRWMLDAARVELVWEESFPSCASHTYADMVKDWLKSRPPGTVVDSDPGVSLSRMVRAGQISTFCLESGEWKPLPAYAWADGNIPTIKGLRNLMVDASALLQKFPASETSIYERVGAAGSEPPLLPSLGDHGQGPDDPPGPAAIVANEALLRRAVLRLGAEQRWAPPVATVAHELALLALGPNAKSHQIKSKKGSIRQELIKERWTPERLAALL